MGCGLSHISRSSQDFPIRDIYNVTTKEQLAAYLNTEHGNEICTGPSDERGYKDKLLLHASEIGATDTVERLLSADARVNFQDQCDGNRTPLILAASKGFTQTVNVLIKWGADLESRGWNALLCASRGGHFYTVLALLKAGSRVNIATETDRTTALNLAAVSGGTKVVKLLLAHQANINHRSKHGTSLGLAIRGNHAHTVDTLLRAGADTEQAFVGSAETSLMLLKHYTGSYIVISLIKYGADIRRLPSSYITELLDYYRSQEWRPILPGSRDHFVMDYIRISCI